MMSPLLIIKRSLTGIERRSSGGTVEPATTLCKAYGFLERDRNYLLRLCQNSKWKAIERCSAIIGGIFANASVDVLSSQARQQLLQTDAWGNTPLHVICYDAPPLAVVEALLKASRHAPGNPIQLLAMANHKGDTPLIISCKSGASQRVVNAMVQNCEEVVTIHNAFGSSAFEVLLQRYSLIQLVPAFRSRYIGLDDIRNKEELLVVEAPHVQKKKVQRKDPSSENIHDLVFSTPPPPNNTLAFPYFWNIMDDLMRAVWSSQNLTNNTEFISHLHGAAFVADVLPTEISDMILRTYADIHDSETKPLHMTLARRMSSHPKARLQHAHLVKGLIAMDPSAATSVIPGTGRSVFCQAIAMGNHWNLDDEFLGVDDGPVQSLFRVCPDVILLRDDVTGLYPFMLASTVLQQEQRGKRDQEPHEDDCHQLDTIYNLLRSSPESIHG
jgi:hypothetical protein